MSQGCEVVHLGHNRSVQEVVDAALEEDVQGVAVSSYQGGHVEYFEYLVESLRAQGAGHVKVVGGGGGVIVPTEIARLRESGVTIFSPEDGQRLGLVGMINSVVADCDVDLWAQRRGRPSTQVLAGDRFAVARAITGAEGGRLDDGDAAPRSAAAAQRRVVPVLGITGTGGSGKSSLTDELVRRFRIDQQDKLRIAVIAVDPTRRKGGGALLGDRIRMNSLDGDRVFFRSLATRGAHEVPEHLADVIDVAQGRRLRPRRSSRRPASARATPAIVPFVDHSLYVMTPEFGAASQLEKIDMLDFADIVAINKFERRGAKDALRDVGRQLVRNREAFGKQPRRHAGLRHQRRDLQRRRRHRALPAPARPARRRTGCRSSEGTLPARRRTPLLRHPPGRARRPGALPRRDHRDRPRLPRADRPSWPRRRAACSASQYVADAARRRRRGRRRRAARGARARPSRTRSPTRSPAGRRSSSPTPATSRSSWCATRRSTPS